MTLRDSREWTTIVSSRTWAGSATNMWERCPRQAWSHGSLIIKHYRVLVGNHHWGYRNLVYDLGLAHQLLFREQINQWLGVLGYTYGMKMISLTDHRILRTCMTDLGWFQRSKNKLSRIHDGNLHQNARESKEVTPFIKQVLHELAWRKCFQSFQH